MKLYKYNIRELSNDEYQKWYSLLGTEKQHKVDRFRFEDDKKRTVVGEMLTRKAISEWCNVAVEDVIFDNKEHGKPYAVGLNVKFNISHSGDIVVCAIDSSPVGIDVERIRPVDLKVAKWICTGDELLYLFGHIPLEQDFAYTTDIVVLTRFFEIWTKKEAYAKWVGKGIDIIKIDSTKIFLQTLFDNNYIISIKC